MNCFIIILAAALWGTTGLFSSYFAEIYNLTTLQIGSVRVISTTILLAIWLLIFNKSSFKIKIKDAWVFVGTGILSVTFFTLCYFEAIKLNGVAVAAVLLYTAPVFVALLSVFVFKTKLTFKTIISIFLAVLGCFFVSGAINSGNNLVSVRGIIVGLGAGFGYALYSIFAKIATKKGYESLTITFYTFLFSSAVLIPFLSFKNLIEKADTDFCIALLIKIAVFGLITGVLPYVFYTKGLKSVSPPIASVTSTVEPVVATLLGVFVLQEKLSFVAIMGIVLIFSSLIVGSLNTKKVE